ncbi:MAG: hypothetical protein WA624_08435 [Methylocella sp.]
MSAEAFPELSAFINQRYNFEAEMRAALDRWVRHVEGLASGVPAKNVVSLRGQVA